MHDADRYETISIHIGEKNVIKEKYVCVCDYQSSKHLHFLFYNSSCLRHTSWSHETGFTSTELCFFFIQNYHLISFIFCIKLY